jgi:TRAP-type C4-dicarboxylate transport system substrate-binding protein
MKGLSSASQIQGLAFTYSGGYRMIAATKSIQSLEDFKGLRIRVAKSPVAEDTLLSVGAEPVPMELEEINDAGLRGDVIGGESTYPRFYSMKQNEVFPVVNDTRHSLFLTSILVNKSFWNSLSGELREVMTEAALRAADVERKESVDDVQVIQDQCRRDGVAVVTLPTEEQEKFKRATEHLYDKYESYFSEGLIKKIQMC